MASTCPANGSSNIYTPQFEASRTNYNITVSWSVLPAGSFSAPIQTLPIRVLPLKTLAIKPKITLLPLHTPEPVLPDWIKLAASGEVSLVDTKNIPVYSLVYEPNPKGIVGTKVSLFKNNRAQLLGSAVIPIRAMNANQLNFKIDLNCQVSGGDIIVSYNKGGIEREYIQCIKVKDKTYQSFNKLKFGYKRGKAGQIAIDNIWVTRSAASATPSPTVARTATPRPRPTPTPPSVDQLPPETDIVLEPAPNEDGWVNSNVQVYFESADDVSGVKETQYKIDEEDDVLIYDPLNPSVITTNGPHTVDYRSVDNAGREEAWRSATFTIDQLAPETTVSPDPGSNWHKGVFTLNFNPTDNAGGSGVAGTWYKYKVDGRVFGDEQTGNTVSFSDSGIYTVEYWSVDNLGNVELPHTVTVKLDNDAPVTTHNLAPPANAAGWNNSDVTISFSATDTGGSGVAETRHKINDVPADGATADPAPITTEGIHQVKYWSIDWAGNVEVEKAVEVKLDKTPPRITGLRPNNFHYQDTLRPEFTATFSDDLSNIDTDSIKLYLKEGTVSGTDFGPELSGRMDLSSTNGNNINMTFTPDHDLIAGVNYTVTYQVLDRAGNKASVSRTFVIDP